MEIHCLNNVEKYKYLGVMVTSTYDICKEIKCRVNMGKACYYSLEKILSSRLLPKRLKVNICKTIILPVQAVLCGCETWSLTLRDEQRLRMFKNNEIRRILGLRETKLQENGESYIIKLNTLLVYSLLNIIRNLKLRRLRWAAHVALMEQSRNV